MPLHLTSKDLREARKRGLLYLDKSALIGELIDQPGIHAQLILRPPGFGKTLNLSMVRYFFQKREEDLSRLFEGLRIWQMGEKYRRHFQRYRVIYLSLEGIEYVDFSRCWAAICTRIRELFVEHRAVLEGGRPSELKARRCREILEGTAGEHLYDRALFYLSQYLHEHHGEKVVILIDAYDTPVLAGHQHGYATEARDWHERFLIAALKDNPHLHKAVVVGTVRLPLGSLWSGSNLVASLPHEQAFADAFGFTETEVEVLLERAGRHDDLALVRDWYGGYNSGSALKYKPSSVLHFLEQDAREPQVFLPERAKLHLEQLLQQQDVREAVQVLLAGDPVELRYPLWMAIDPPTFEEKLWRLMFMGYLTAEKRSYGPSELPAYILSVPNREMRRALVETLAGG